MEFQIQFLYHNGISLDVTYVLWKMTVLNNEMSRRSQTCQIILNHMPISQDKEIHLPRKHGTLFFLDIHFHFVFLLTSKKN